MKNRKSSRTIAMAAVFIATVIAYSCYHPFRAGEVFKAIPGGASCIHHEDSLNELLLNLACVTQLNQALGAGNSLQQLLDETQWEAMAVPSEIVVAHVPHGRIWVASSWVGWRSPWLRWRLDHVSDERLQPVRNRTVWPVWRYESADIARGQSLYFALTENLFLVCLSDRLDGMLYLLDTYDLNTPKRRR